MNKGLGIKIQDIVIFDFEMTNNERVLNYIKNSVYAEEEEREMVKEFIRASEIKRADSTITDDVSPEIKKELAEEGICITNEGVFKTPADPEYCEGMLPDDELPFYGKELNPELISVLTNEERRTISIYLQSSIKQAVEIICPETVAQYSQAKGIAIDLTEWIDRNSTQILMRAEKFLEKKNEVQKH
jgi:hypothetical protein